MYIAIIHSRDGCVICSRTSNPDDVLDLCDSTYRTQAVPVVKEAMLFKVSFLFNFSSLWYWALTPEILICQASALSLSYTVFVLLRQGPTKLARLALLSGYSPGRP